MPRASGSIYKMRPKSLASEVHIHVYVCESKPLVGADRCLILVDNDTKHKFAILHLLSA